MKQFWIVVRMDSHKKSNDPPHQHDTADSAMSEAKRLATSYPGIEFGIFESDCTVVKGGLTIVPHERERPF